MLPSLIKTANAFEKNVDKFQTASLITKVLKSIAELEKISTNKANVLAEMDSFYDTCAKAIESKLQSVNSLQGLGDIVVSFAKVKYYPEEIMEGVKAKVIHLFLSERIERKNSEVFAWIVYSSERIETLKKKVNRKEEEVATIDRSQSNPKVQELADLRQQLKSLEVQIAAKIANFLFGTNSVFEMAKLIAGISAFAPMLKNDSDEFLEEFYNILLTSLTEVHQNKVVMDYFVTNTQHMKLILIMQ
jgi:hypothetical protein